MIFTLRSMATLRRSALAARETDDRVPERPAMRVRRGEGNQARQAPPTGSADGALQDGLAGRAVNRGWYDCWGTGDQPRALHLPQKRASRRHSDDREGSGESWSA